MKITKTIVPQTFTAITGSGKTKALQHATYDSRSERL